MAKSSAEGRNEFKKDGKRVEAMDFEFDRVIKGDPENDDAHFLVDVSVVPKKEGRSYNVFEGRTSGTRVSRYCRRESSRDMRLGRSLCPMVLSCLRSFIEHSRVW